MRNRRRIVLLLVPALILYLGLFIYPAVRALWVSLHSWTGFTAKMEWVGLANFEELIHDDLYWRTFATTLKIIFIGGAAIFLLAFLFTFFLTSGIRGKKIYRAVIFYPNVVAPIALATFWGFILNPRFGLLNGLLRSLGLESWTQTWTGPDLVFWSILTALVWTYVGLLHGHADVRGGQDSRRITTTRRASPARAGRRSSSGSSSPSSGTCW